MAVLRAAARNAMGEAWKTNVGASAKLQLRTGTLPSGEPSLTGTMLAELPLPATWMGAFGAVTAGVANLAGAWTALSVAVGTIGHAVMLTNAGVATGMFTVSLTGGGGEVQLNDLTVDDIDQQVDITAFSFTVGGAPV